MIGNQESRDRYCRFGIRNSHRLPCLVCGTWFHNGGIRGTVSLVLCRFHAYCLHQKRDSDHRTLIVTVFAG